MKLRAALAAVATILVIAPAAGAKDKPEISKEQAREASIGYVYSSGSCRTREWGECEGVTASSCKRVSAQLVTCLAEWGGTYTDPFSGEVTGTWSCEQTLGWRATSKQPKLAQTTASTCS